LLLQVLLSFMPDLESAWLCSIIGAAMSLGYSFIAVALGAAQVCTLCCTLYCMHCHSCLSNITRPCSCRALGIARAFGAFGLCGACLLQIPLLCDGVTHVPHFIRMSSILSLYHSISTSNMLQLHCNWGSLTASTAALQAHNGLGELAGRSAPPVDKLFGVLTSLGNVAFAYNSCVVMIEIQVNRCCSAAALHAGRANACDQHAAVVDVQSSQHTFNSNSVVNINFAAHASHTKCTRTVARALQPLIVNQSTACICVRTLSYLC
jgi:hypothetical protein